MVHEGHSHEAAANADSGHEHSDQSASEVRPDRDLHAELDDAHCDVLGLHHAPIPQVFEAGLAPLNVELLEPSAPAAPKSTSAPAQYSVAPKNSPPRV